jgi:hypothetical protein
MAAGAERDLPSTQRLEAVVLAATSLSTDERRDHRNELLRVADVLRGQQELAVRLAAVDWAEPGGALAAIASRLDDHPLLAGPAMSAVAQALHRDQTAWGPHSLASAADGLIPLGSPGAGAVALQLAQSVGVRFGWPEPWRDRLRALRSHPSADLAALASRVWTAPE